MLKSKTKINVSDKVSKNIDLPITNETISYIYNLADPMTQYLIDISSLEKIQELNMCLFNVSQKQLKFFERMQELFLLPLKINIVLSQRIKAMIPGTYNYLKENKNFNIGEAHSHAKFCTIKTENNYYTIVTSANTNADKKIEQLTIINNEDVYNFHKNFLTKWLEVKEK